MHKCAQFFERVLLRTMEQEQTSFNTQSEISNSCSNPIDFNKCPHQIVEEEYRSTIQSHDLMVYFPIDRAILYSKLNDELLPQERIKAVMTLDNYTKRIKRVVNLQRDLLENVDIVKLIKSGLCKDSSLQLKYEIINLIVTIIRQVSPQYPLYQILFTSNPVLLARVINQMLKFKGNKYINRLAILMLHRLLKRKNQVITRYVLRKKLIVSINELIRTKRIQQIKPWFCEIIFFAVTAYKLPQQEELLSEAEFDVILVLVIEMGRRNRSVIYVKGILQKIAYSFNYHMIQMLAPRVDKINQFFRAIRIFTKEFLKIARNALPLLTLQPEVLDIIIDEIDFALENEDREGHYLIAEIMNHLYAVRNQLKQESWEKLKALSIKLLKACPLLQGESWICRLDLYIKMLAYSYQFFSFSKDFVLILIRIEMIKIQRTAYLNLNRHTEFIEERGDEIYQDFCKFMQTEEGKQLRPQIMKMLKKSVKKEILGKIQQKYPLLLPAKK